MRTVLAVLVVAGLSSSAVTAEADGALVTVGPELAAAQQIPDDGLGGLETLMIFGVGLGSNEGNLGSPVDGAVVAWRASKSSPKAVGRSTSRSSLPRSRGCIG